MNIDPYWYLASYPKSGNTWCRVFISELHRLISLEKSSYEDEYEFKLNDDLQTGTIISSRSWIDDQLGFDSSELDFDELELMRGNIINNKSIYYEGLRYHKVHDSYLTLSNKEKSIVNSKNCAGIVYIIRNPLDIAISMHHFFKWSIDECVEFILDKNACLCSSSKKAGLQVRQFLGDWETHVNSWINQKEIPILVVRYEDLLEKPYIYFKKVSQFLKIEANEEKIARAINNASFDNLKNKESLEGGFIEKPQKCEKFFRSGKSGEGLEQLKKTQIDLIIKEFSKTLKEFNYL